MQNVGKKKSSVLIQLSGWLRTLDMVEMTGPDKASLVSLFFNYMPVLLRKTWTMQVQALSEFQRAKNRYHKNIFKKTNNNNPKQGGSKTKPL